MDNFKEASKVGLRFLTSKGNLSVEQLWHLSIADLATCVRAVKKLLNKNEEDDLDFLDSTKVVDATEQLRFDILKDVYLSKKAEADDKRTAKEQKENNQKILQLIAEKQDESLKGKTIEELTAMLK